MIKVTYYYSACVGLESADISILCDPWFSEGIYDGSWYHFPKIENPLELIPRYDLVYVSHIHPDHYDSKFLLAYLNKNKDSKVIIGATNQKFLSAKMRSDGIPHSFVDELTFDNTKIKIIPNGSNPYDIDTALAMVCRSHSVANMNDNLFDETQIDEINKFCGGGPTIALLGYTGAGSYPQTYYSEKKVLTEKSEQKKLQFFDRYKKMRTALNPRVAIPFAGKYILGGSLYHLNPYRGIADAVEVTKFDESAIVLADAGGSIDTDTLCATAVRSQPYDLEAMSKYAKSLSDIPMDYVRFFNEELTSNMPLKRLLQKAYRNASANSFCKGDYFFCFRLKSSWAIANARSASDSFSFQDSVENLFPRSEIYIDERYLFGLLTCVFHWNNAEVGSQYMTKRLPDVFNRDAQAFLNYFHV